MTPSTPAHARAVIDDALGRPVQDGLEAAVVLEAWSGVPADEALVLGRLAAIAPGSVPPPTSGPVATPAFDVRAVASDVAFIIAVLFVGFWLSRRTDRFAVDDIDRAWRLALPISLGAQWFLRRRVFLGGEGLGRLRREQWLLVPAAALLGMLLLAPARVDGAAHVNDLPILPWAGVLACSLAVLWIAGFVVSRRGWGIPYSVCLVGVLVAGSSRSAALPVLVLVVAATLGIAVVAVRTTPRSDRLPGALGRAVPSALVGAGMGLFLVSEPRFAWAASGLLSAFTIVPSLLGSLVGGLWMTRLWRMLPAKLRAVTVEGRTRVVLPGLPAVRLFAQAVVLALAVATSCSAVVIWRDHAPAGSDSANTTRMLLFAHAALALAGLCVALLETLGRWGRALLATSVGVVAAFSLAAFERGEPTAGSRILVGALVALGLSLPAVLGLLARPDHRIAAVT